MFSVYTAVHLSGDRDLDLATCWLGVSKGDGQNYKSQQGCNTLSDFSLSLSNTNRQFGGKKVEKKVPEGE